MIRVAATLLLILALASPACAEGVIGRDTLFNIATVQVLSGNEPYNQAFNFFFTLELFFGLFALWMRLLIRVFRM